MAELQPADVEKYTNGRLKADDPETAAMLTRALAGARRYCGWMVTPVAADVDIVLDGPGTRDLFLPTMNLTAVSVCVEDGVPLDVTQLTWSRMGIIRKKSRHRWSCEYGSIRITVTHGYDETDAADWRGAVLKACDLAAINVGPQIQEYSVDTVLRKWFKNPVFSFDTAILDQYRLMGVA